MLDLIVVTRDGKGMATRKQLKAEADRLLAADGFVDCESWGGYLTGTPYRLRPGALSRETGRETARPTQAHHEEYATQWDAVRAASGGLADRISMLDDVCHHAEFEIRFAALEREALQLLANGLSRHDVAAQVGVSVRAVAELYKDAMEWIR